MEFEEIFTSQLTTATTCYSGARNPNCQTLRLATESHVLGFAIVEDIGNKTEESKDERFQLSCDCIPVIIGTNSICVGFSQFDDTTQALAMVDPERLQDFQEIPTLHQPPTNDKDDSMSVLSNANSVTDTLSVNRRPSNDAGSTSTANTNPVPNHKKSNSDISGSASIGIEVENKTVQETSSTPKARLVLQTPNSEYGTTLEFRPLCPCIARLGEGTIGIWVGSAEDAQVRFYVPSTIDSNQQQLTPLVLPEEHFTVHTTPVMSLDFLNNNDQSTLAVACQDGTIQLTSWRGSDFKDLNSYKVIVDGPLVSLQLQSNYASPSPSIRVVVGSLCGYVCELVKHEQDVWEGPSMIVQGFWNDTIEAEDSILAVHVFNDQYIAIGTHSGRCLLYQNRNPYRQRQSKYQKVWESLLPYSVHSILVPKNSDSSVLRLVVTTRRSLHVFQLRGPLSAWNVPARSLTYSAALAKERLLGLLTNAAAPNLEGEERQAPPVLHVHQSSHLSRGANTDSGTGIGEGIDNEMGESIEREEDELVVSC